LAILLGAEHRADFRTRFRSPRCAHDRLRREIAPVLDLANGLCAVMIRNEEISSCC
jgi:hypothetical protein